MYDVEEEEEEEVIAEFATEVELRDVHCDIFVDAVLSVDFCRDVV